MGLGMRPVEIFEVGEVVLLWDSAEVGSGVEIGDTRLLRADGGTLVDGG